MSWIFNVGHPLRRSIRSHHSNESSTALPRYLGGNVRRRSARNDRGWRAIVRAERGVGTTESQQPVNIPSSGLFGPPLRVRTPTIGVGSVLGRGTGSTAFDQPFQCEVSEVREDKCGAHATSREIHVGRPPDRASCAGVGGTMEGEMSPVGAREGLALRTVRSLGNGGPRPSPLVCE